MTGERDNTTESNKELDEWLNAGYYHFGEKFNTKSGEFRAIEAREEFDAVVDMCIKENLLGLTPEDIRDLFGQ